MLLFGHAGITLTAYYALERFMGRHGRGAAAARIDYRLALLGSILPDLIDKPLGILSPDTMGYGRGYAHTLLFLILITVAGLVLWRKRKRPGVLVLAGGCFLHLILDSMWQQPGILLWPLYSLAHGLPLSLAFFMESPPKLWLSLWMSALLSNPVVYLSELYGLLFFGWVLLFRRGLLAGVVKRGRLD